MRLVIAILVLAAAVIGSLRAYVGYEAHRAGSMLAEASRLQIGESEGSVLAMVQRYGGFKWTPEPLPPKEQWIDRDEYDYETDRLSDHKYELAVSPFGSFSFEVGRLAEALGAVRRVVPLHLRMVLGIRDWTTRVELSIQKGRVQSVSAMTFVEGRSEWLGHRWELADGMPHHNMRPQAYAIGEAHLTTADGGGRMIENFLTPKASEEEVNAARGFNSECLTSTKGCSGLCDVAPRALEYLKQYPDTAWNIIPPKCQ
jgi:hypothetical protein